MTETHVSAERLATEIKRLISEGKMPSNPKKSGGFPSSSSAIIRRMKRDNINPVEVPAAGGRDGVRFEYPIAAIPGLPSVVRDVFGCEAVSNAAKAGAKAAREKREEIVRTAEELQKHKEDCQVKFNAIPGERQTAALAKQEVLLACEEFLKGGGYKGRSKDGRKSWNTEGAKKFIQKAIDPQSKLLPAWVTAELKRKGEASLGYRTLISWRETYELDGVWGLSDKYMGHDSCTLTKDHKKFVVACLIENPKTSMKMLHKGTEARFKIDIPSVHAINRYIKKWISEHESQWLYITNPDEWKNKYMFGAGNASELIEALNQLWEEDSTPGDVMLTDGRHSIIGIIDVYSRRPRFLVTPTSKSESIAALNRYCIINWGKPTGVKTDNGQDYKSVYLRAVFYDLEIDQTFCPPFTPECKPHIERMLQTMSHGIVELLPGYIGHSVTERKAIEGRKTFAQRLMTKGEVVEIKLSSVEFQEILDRWTDAMYMHEPHAGLDGKTPAQMVRDWPHPVMKVSNERALDLLLQPAPEKGGWRVITKKGIRITMDAAILDYVAPEFCDRAGERVQVKPDRADLGHAAIYLESGEFLCWAEDPTWYGISNAEAASHLKAKQKKVMQDGAKVLKAEARALKTKGIAMEILEYSEEKLRAQSSNVVEMPKRTVDFTTPALEEAAKALDIRDNGRIPSPPPPTPEQLEMKSQIKAELQRRSSSNVVGLVQETMKQKFKRWKALKADLKDGVTISEENYSFVVSYEKSSECQAFLMVEADLGSMSK